MPSVRLDPRFIADLERQERWLVDNDREEWLVNLFAGIQELAGLLRMFPQAGSLVRRDARFALRRLRVRRYAYVVWYLHRRTEPVGDVWLMRLFGAHQDRPDPDPSSWTPHE